MKYPMPIIKQIDMYGKNFLLRINSQSKFKSFVGGILSIITVGVLLFCILSFSDDFYNRKNPKITTTDGYYDKYTIPTVNKTNYEPTTVIFSMSKSLVDKIYPVVNQLPDSNLTNAKLCDAKYLLKSQIIESEEDILLKFYNYFCINVNDFSISADFTKSFFGVYLVECSSLDNQFKLDNKIVCDEEFIKNKQENISSINVDFYYDKIGFDANQEYPFVKNIEAYPITLDITKVTLLSFNFQVTRLVDDRALVLKSEKTITVINPESNLKLNTYENNNKRRYPAVLIKFALSSQYKIYNRTYQKLQELIANIGGFMKVIISCFNFINMLFATYSIDMHLLDTLFRRNEEPSSSELVVLNLENSIESSSKIS